MGDLKGQRHKKQSLLRRINSRTVSEILLELEGREISFMFEESFDISIN